MKQVLLGFTICMLLAGCQKSSFAPLPEKESSLSKNGLKHNTGCDFNQVTSSALWQGDYWEEPQVLPLLVKQYGPDGSLQHLRARFRNSAYGTSYLLSFDVTYMDRQMILYETGHEDTTAIIHFGANGRPDFAVALPWILGLGEPSPYYSGNYWQERQEFRFQYQGGRLSEVQTRWLSTGSQVYEWFPYVKLLYDKGYKNVIEVQHFGIMSLSYQSTFLSYDYSRKATGQMYGDFYYGDYASLFVAFKYLNLFPELQSQNLLTYAKTGSEGSYPGLLEHFYSGHVLDGGGRLVSYMVNGETWNLNWNCTNNMAN